MMNLDKTGEAAVRITIETGKYILNERRLFSPEKIKDKSFNNFVTKVDTSAEERLVSELKKILPEAGFITEEVTVANRQEEYTWIIDPLDGTTNFIHGLPCYAISVALMHEQELVLGIIYEINQDECFFARKGKGAFLNNRRISTTKTKKLQDSLIATGFPYDDFHRLDEYLNIFTHLMQSTRGIRRLGSAAVDLAYVACGRFDVFYEYGLNPWDVAAGTLIVQEAGGTVSDFNGGEDFLFGEEIIACTEGVYNEFLKLTKEKF